MSWLNLALLVMSKSIERANIRVECGNRETLVLSWLLDQQNWLGFVRQTGIFKTWIFKAFLSFRHFLCYFAFPQYLHFMPREKWWFVGRLVEKLQQRMFLHSLRRGVSGGVWFLQNCQNAARSKADLVLSSVHFEKCRMFWLSLVDAFLSSMYFKRNRNLAERPASTEKVD